MSAPDLVELELIKGDTFRQAFFEDLGTEDDPGLSQPWFDTPREWTLRGQARQTYDSETALATLSEDDGSIAVDTTTRSFELVIEPLVTWLFPRGDCWLDIIAIHDSGETRTIARLKFAVLGRATALP